MNDTADDDIPLVMKGDALFSLVKSAANLATKGIQSIFCVKQCHALFPKQFITDALKNAPGGVSIEMKGNHCNGHTLIAMGYRYSSKKTLFFVMTDGAGSTTPGQPYKMKFTDDYGNVGKSITCYYCLLNQTNHSFIILYSFTEVRYVERPDVISNFFRYSNCVDSANHARQYELAMKNG